MKKIVLLCCLAGFLTVFMSCDREEVSTEAPVLTENVGIVAMARGLASYNRKDPELNEFENARDQLSFGDEVVILDETVEGPLGRFTITYRNIRTSEDRERWVNDRYVLADAVRGVIVNDNTLLYNEPDLTKASQRLLQKGQLLAVSKEKVRNFYQVAGWDYEAGSGFSDVWVAADRVSVNPADVDTVILINTAEGVRNPAAAEQILRSAEGLSSRHFRSELSQAIRDLQQADEPEPEAPAASVPAQARRETEDFSSSGRILSDNVRVRNLPNEVGSEIITTLDSDTQIDITQRTVSSYTIDNMNARWFKISEPEGWVYGGFVAIDR